MVIEVVGLLVEDSLEGLELLLDGDHVYAEFVDQIVVVWPVLHVVTPRNETRLQGTPTRRV